MAEATCTIKEIRLTGGEAVALIDCPARIAPTAGQYLLAFAPGLDEALPTPIFPAGRADGFLTAAPPLPAGWTAGMRLHLRGPYGHGFTLPLAARHVALVDLNASPHRLLSLLEPAMKQNAEVTLLSAARVHGLPSQVELLPVDALGEILAWSDYLALDLPAAALPDLRKRLGLGPGGRAACAAQALVRTALLCGGMPACGVCTVETKNGRRLACKDGPVFDLNDLLKD